MLLTLIFVSYLVARTVLPPALRLLAAHFSAELFQLVIVAFCLSNGYITGHLVRLADRHAPHLLFASVVEPAVAASRT